jgi:D-arabinose 1-dehydrogenase-like Zn-dependent alcohol dehydrogenase
VIQRRSLDRVPRVSSTTWTPYRSQRHSLTLSYDSVGACYECKLCKSDNENYCPKQVDTYNAKYSNGDIAHGGYSNAIRVHERFGFALPESLTDENVASMLCAGLTVWAPLRRFNVGPGSKVAVAGIGGLGHYAVQFASALGAEVTAISHQADKEVSFIGYRSLLEGTNDSLQADVRQMGAKHFINTTSKDFAASHAGSFDLILSTIDDVAVRPIILLIRPSLKPRNRDFPSRNSFRCSLSTDVSTPVVSPIPPSLLSTLWT